MRSERQRKKHRQARSRKRAARRRFVTEHYVNFGPFGHSRFVKVEFLQHALNDLMRAAWNRPDPFTKAVMKNV